MKAHLLVNWKNKEYQVQVGDSSTTFARYPSYPTRFGLMIWEYGCVFLRGFRCNTSACMIINFEAKFDSEAWILRDLTRTVKLWIWNVAAVMCVGKAVAEFTCHASRASRQVGCWKLQSKTSSRSDSDVNEMLQDIVNYSNIKRWHVKRHLLPVNEILLALA